MRRNRQIVLVALALACAVLLPACGGSSSASPSGSASNSGSEGSAGGSSGSNPLTEVKGPAPQCAPKSIDHSAKLAGTPVEVSPEPDTDTANPQTQISFLGVPSSQINGLSVQGSSSGAHSGRLEPYSQGDGASFVPSKPFQAGEEVHVRATVSGHPVSYSFQVDTPLPTGGVAAYNNAPAPSPDWQSYYTLPGAEVPDLKVTTPDQDPGAGDIFTNNGAGPGAYGPLIYTPQGQLVWYHELPHDWTGEDVNVQEYEGHKDLTFWQGKVLIYGYGQGEDVVMNDRYQTVTKVRGGNGLKADLHEFRIEPHDVAFVTAFNTIRCNLSKIEEGPANGAVNDVAIQEIDMKTGLVRWEWHALDHIGLTESETSPPEDNPWDWFHLNSIDPQPDGNILISARGTWAAYLLEGGSGKVLWRLGGLKSSFKMGPGAATAWQHDARMLSNGEITMFDDGANPPKHTESRGVRIKLDTATHEATLSQAFPHPDPPLRAASQGNMQTLADGNTVVEFGGVPEMTEFSPSGKVLFDAHLPYDLISYRGFRDPWSARPASPPAVVASLNNTDEETIVRSSWNGATDVASWRVLGSTSTSGSLKSLTTVPSQGFETETIVIDPSPEERYESIEVQALSSQGKVLGTSKRVKPESYKGMLAKYERSGK